MTWTTTWRSLVVLALTAVTVVALVTVVRPIRSANVAGPVIGIPVVSPTPLTADGCERVPDGQPAGSERAARLDAAELSDAVTALRSPQDAGVSVGRCGLVWVVKLRVGDPREIYPLPYPARRGTLIVPVLGQPFQPF